MPLPPRVNNLGFLFSKEERFCMLDLILENDSDTGQENSAAHTQKNNHKAHIAQIPVTR